MKTKLAFGLALLCGSIAFGSSAFARQAQECTLVHVYVTYHASTGQTTTVYVYDC